MIQPISAIKPAKVTPLKDAKPAIEATLLDKAKTDAITKILDRRHQELLRQEGCATGFAPPALRHDSDDDHRLSLQCLERATTGSPRRSSTFKS